MRIVWLSQFVPYPPSSGALERSFHLIRRACERHEVHLLALEQRGLARDGPPLAERVAALERLCATVRICHMPFERGAVARLSATGIGLLAPFPADRVWLYSGAMHREAAKLAARQTATLLHVDTMGLLPYARRFTGVPIVLNHHNVESALTDRRAARDASWRAWLLRREARKQRHAERRMCPTVAMNVVVSHLDAARLRDVAPGSPIAVVPNGVDTDYFVPAADPGPGGGLVFVGTLGWFANREAARMLATEVLPALAAAGRHRRLALVGRNPQRGDWRASAAVDAPGYVPDVRPFVRDACVYVCPLRDGGGTRMKVLAALAMAKPLVATALAVEGLSLVEGTHYLGAESPGEFVTQICRLEDDPGLRRRLGAAGRELVVREYGWPVVARELDAAYAAAEGRAAAW